MRAGLPYARPPMTVGLFGGSFDPPHEGHVHVSREALKRFGLDRVWWLVSPGNPLKAEGPAPLARRMAAARALIRHPRIEATDIEAHLGTRFTAETLEGLFRLYPGVRFVWLMGADNLVGFANWQRHDVIAGTMPIAVIDRPGYSYRALKAGAALLRRRITPRQMARNLALSRRGGNRWCFIAGRRHHASATALRQADRTGTGA